MPPPYAQDSLPIHGLKARESGCLRRRLSRCGGGGRGGLRQCRRRQGSGRTCVHNADGGVGSRSDRTRPFPTTHRCRPSRCEDSMRLRVMRWRMPRSRTSGAGGRPRSPCRHGACQGRRRRGPRGERMGGMSRTGGSRPLLVLHAGTGDAERQRQSVPVGDQMDFDPDLPRSVGFGPVGGPSLAARALADSIAHRDRTSFPRAPSALRTRRWSLAPTRAPVQCVNR